MKKNQSTVSRFSFIYDWLKLTLVAAVVWALVFFNDRLISISTSLVWLARIGVAGVSLAALLTTTYGRQFGAFALQAWRELCLVVWPSRPEVERITIVVIAIVTLVSALLWLVDAGLMRLIRVLIYHY